MSLYETLQDDLKKSLKEKNSRVVSVLRMVLASVKNAELEKRAKMVKEDEGLELSEKSKLSDEEIIGVLVRESKKRKEAVEGFTKGGKKEMAIEEEEEKKIIDKYLPEQISEEGINEEIEKTIKETEAVGMKDFGKVMGLLMVKLKNKADGKVVGELLKKKLQ